MTRMKDSGIEWIGEVPEDWVVTKFKFLGTAKNGLTYSPENIVEQTEGVLVLRSGNIQNNKLVFDNNVYVNSQIEPSIFLKKGDILITARNGSANLIGKNAIVEESILATYGAFMMVFRVNKRMKSKFAYYLMNSSFDFYRTFFTTSTVNQLTAGIFYNIEVPLPTIVEQTQIADFLDKKVAQLDKVKSLLEEQIKTLEDYRQSLIYETVTKGLDKTVPLKESGVDWIGQIPEGWGVTRFKYFIDIKSGENFVNDKSVEGIYPVLGGGNKVLGTFNRYNVDEENIIIGRVGSAGSVTNVLKQSFATDNALVVKTREIKDFIYYLLESADLPRLSTSNAQPLITASKILEHFTVLPSKDEQKEIADYINEKIKIINLMLEIKKEQIENINKQRQTLIYDVVTGKRRV